MLNLYACRFDPIRADQTGMENQTPPELLTKKLIVKHFIPAGVRTLDRWISSRVFPPPEISIGGKVRYWRRATVEAWIAVQCGEGGEEIPLAG